MERKHRRGSLAGLLVAIVAAAGAGTAAAGPDQDNGRGPLERGMHHPMQPHLNFDKTWKRGLRNQIITGNWSGYAVTAGAPYTTASATWQVPDIKYDGRSTPYGYEYVTNWVGIGGYGDSTLIQLGTESVVSTSGARTYYVWYELYPAVMQSIPRTVKPGDIVTASLQCTAACSPTQVQTWLLTMTDTTAGVDLVAELPVPVEHAFGRMDRRGAVVQRHPAARRLRAGDVRPGLGQRRQPEPVIGRQRHPDVEPLGADLEPVQPGQRQHLQHLLGAGAELHAVHRRLVHGAAASPDRDARGQPEIDRRGPILDPHLELDQRRLVQGRRLHRGRHLGLGHSGACRHHRLFDHLHRRRRIGDGAGDGHGRLDHAAADLPRQEMPVRQPATKKRGRQAALFAERADAQADLRRR
jgi:hypothetical protein